MINIFNERALRFHIFIRDISKYVFILTMKMQYIWVVETLKKIKHKKSSRMRMKRALLLSIACKTTLRYTRIPAIYAYCNIVAMNEIIFYCILPFSVQLFFIHIIFIFYIDCTKSKSLYWYYIISIYVLLIPYYFHLYYSALLCHIAFLLFLYWVWDFVAIWQ